MSCVLIMSTVDITASVATRDIDKFVGIKDRPILHVNDNNISDTLYISGFKSIVTNEYIVYLLNMIDIPIEIDLSYRKKTGRVWVKYNTIQATAKTMLYLNQCSHNDEHLIYMGCNLSIKYELGIRNDQKRVVSTNHNYHHSTIIRHIRIIPPTHATSVSHESTLPITSYDNKSNMTIQPVKLKNAKILDTTQCELCNKSNRNTSTPSSSSFNKITYTSNSLLVNNSEYPFPTGLYLTRVIQLMKKTMSSSSMTSEDPLLDLITNTSIFGNNYNKEISESMSMVDNVFRAIAIINQTHSVHSTLLNDNHYRHHHDNSHGSSDSNCSGSGSGIIDIDDKDSIVNVFVLGDGMYPVTAACLCLHLPEHWCFYSIDPLMKYSNTSALGQQYVFVYTILHYDVFTYYAIIMQPFMIVNGLHCICVYSLHYG